MLQAAVLAVHVRAAAAKQEHQQLIRVLADVIDEFALGVDRPLDADRGATVRLALEQLGRALLHVRPLLREPLVFALRSYTVRRPTPAILAASLTRCWDSNAARKAGAQSLLPRVRVRTRGLACAECAVTPATIAASPTGDRSPICGRCAPVARQWASGAVGFGRIRSDETPCKSRKSADRRGFASDYNHRHRGSTKAQ